VPQQPNSGLFSLTVEVSRSHTDTHNTPGRTPLNEWSTRRTAHNKHKRQTAMPSAGFVDSKKNIYIYFLQWYFYKYAQFSIILIINESSHFLYLTSHPASRLVLSVGRVPLVNEHFSHTNRDFKTSFIPSSTLRQVHCLYQSQCSIHCDLVLPLSVSNILSFP
jgi:hypothetical protein